MRSPAVATAARSATARRTPPRSAARSQWSGVRRIRAARRCARRESKLAGQPPNPAIPADCGPSAALPSPTAALLRSAAAAVVRSAAAKTVIVESSRVACRRFAPRTLCSLFLATTLWLGAASAHSERVSGVVLSVLPDRREVVVRRDVFGAKPALTTLFRLSPKLDSTSLHAGDHIVAEIAQRNGALLLDDVRVVASAPGSVLRAARLLQVGEHMPATRFVDQFGHGFDFAAFRGKSVVLAFIYTRCADPRECPLISSNFHTLQKRLANGSYHLVELTLDPTYDRPPVLARYGALFGADAKRWTLGTGDPGSVLDFEAR